MGLFEDGLRNGFRRGSPKEQVRWEKEKVNGLSSYVTCGTEERSERKGVRETNCEYNLQ